MRHGNTLRALWATAMLSLLSLGCAPDYPPLPITQESQPMQALNARLRGTAPPVAEHVTGARLVRARSEPQNWPTYYGAYDGQRYSPLDQINTGNVDELRPAWVFQYDLLGLVPAPATPSFEASPIVIDGTMYVSGPDGYVWALNAATGEPFWEYHHAVPLDVPLCCGNVNRGVAVAHGKVLFVTPNAHLIALDAVTGEPVWDRVFADIRAGESATLAPLVIEDKVLVGSSGAEYGVRGHIDAFEIETGHHLWRFYPVPKPGEPGSETWTADSWAHGGGTAWITGTYDPELDLTYWGTGNPGPDFNGDVRPGANLYTSSVVALDPDTGTLRWYYQFTPHDVWDYDGNNENILIDRDGRRLLAHFDKNGYLFVLDRTNGRLVHATPFFPKADWGTIDRDTGEVTVHKVPTSEGTRICPGPAGAKEWPHAAYSRQTGLLYTPVVELCAIFRKFHTEFRESLPYWGGELEIAPEQRAGHLKAFDPLTGDEIWAWETDHPVLGSTLTTGGGLVFTGLATGEVVALDAHSGHMLWSFQTGSGIHGSPMTYSVDGRQYLAVPSGWGGWLEGYAPQLYGASRGGALFVFALP